MGTQFEMSYK